MHSRPRVALGKPAGGLQLLPGGSPCCTPASLMRITLLQRESQFSFSNAGKRSERVHRREGGRQEGLQSDVRAHPAACVLDDSKKQSAFGASDCHPREGTPLGSKDLKGQVFPVA